MTEFSQAVEDGEFHLGDWVNAGLNAIGMNVPGIASEKSKTYVDSATELMQQNIKDHLDKLLIMEEQKKIEEKNKRNERISYITKRLPGIEQRTKDPIGKEQARFQRDFDLLKEARDLEMMVEEDFRKK